MAGRAGKAGDTAQAVARRPGRPSGDIECVARMTVRLDERRHDGLRRLAYERRRTVQSLLLEGADLILEGCEARRTQRVGDQVE